MADSSTSTGGAVGLLGRYMANAFEKVVSVSTQVMRSKSKWKKAGGKITLNRITNAGKVHPYAPGANGKDEGDEKPQAVNLMPVIQGWGPEAEEALMKLWDKIDESATTAPPARKMESRRYGEWVTARVFISSTFTDTFAERECLLKRVLPEIRRRAEKLHIHIQDTDLRWGVPPDSSAEFTIRKCLSEIDRCIQDNHGRPFFLCLLSERFGWCPGYDDVPKAVRELWDWQDTLSITSHEILHGAYRQANPNALFTLRDGSFQNQDGFLALSEGERAMFVDGKEELKTKMRVLKERLLKKFAPTGQVLENYPCQVGGMDHQGKIRLRGLEKFQEWCTEALWDAIVAQYGELTDAPGSDNGAGGPLAGIAIDGATQRIMQSTLMHRIFIEQKTKSFVGRVALLEELLAKSAALMDGKAKNRTNLMLVAGVPGCGKSALMAMHASQCMSQLKGVTTYFHFTGVAPGSTAFDDCVKRLIREIQKQIDPRMLASPLPADYGDLLGVWHATIQEAARRGKVLILFDAINQFEDVGRVMGLKQWIPLNVPNVGVVVSLLPGPILDSLRVMGTVEVFGIEEVFVGAMTRKEQADLVAQTLGFFNKELNESQMDTLLDKKGASSVLWLMLACEELHVYGIFEKVNAKITGMKDDVQGLFEQVLLRLEQELGLHLVRDCMALLACSRDGLLELELRDLLSPDDDEPLPAGKWSELFNQISFCLRPPGQGEEGTIDFFHQQLVITVSRRYLQARIEGLDASVFYHRKLAMYFKSLAMQEGSSETASFNDCPRALRVLSHHQRRAELTLDVMVAVRCRPMNTREKAMGARCIIHMEGSTCTIYNPEHLPGDSKGPSLKGDDGEDLGVQTMPAALPSRAGSRDKGVLRRNSVKATVFNMLGVEVLQNAFDGFNVSFFTYGQTGSGKTYSTFGSPSDKGLVPHVCKELFRRIAESASADIEYEVELSMMEIYREKVFDLLNKDNSPPNGLTVRADKTVVSVEGLEARKVRDFESINGAIQKGDKARAMASTAMNDSSSRSHTLVSINLIQRRKSSGTEMKGRVWLVDLAGSERTKTREAEGGNEERRAEGVAINKSLTVLNRCIKGMALGVKGEALASMPFRDSKLTLIMREALSGGSKIIMLAAVSPAEDSYNETLSTLKYASMAKRIGADVAKKKKGPDMEEADDAAEKATAAESFRLSDSLADILLGSGANCAMLVKMMIEARDGLKELVPSEDASGSAAAAPGIKAKSHKPMARSKSVRNSMTGEGGEGGGGKKKKKGKFGTTAKKMKALGGLFMGEQGGAGGGTPRMPALEDAGAAGGGEDAAANGDGDGGGGAATGDAADKGAKPAVKKKKEVPDGVKKKMWQDVKQAMMAKTKPERMKKLLNLLGILLSDKAELQKQGAEACGQKVLKETPQRIAAYISETWLNRLTAPQRKALAEAATCPDVVEGAQTDQNIVLKALYMWIVPAHLLSDLWAGLAKQDIPDYLQAYWKKVSDRVYQLMVLEGERAAVWDLTPGSETGGKSSSLGASMPRGGSGSKMTMEQSNDEIAVVGAWMARSSHVKEVDVSGHHMSAATAEKLCNAAVGCSALNALRVSEFNACAVGALHCAKAIKAKPGLDVTFTLDDKDVGASSISKRDTRALVELVQLSTSEGEGGDPRISRALLDAISTSDSYVSTQAMWLMNFEHQRGAIQRANVAAVKAAFVPDESGEEGAADKLGSVEARAEAARNPAVPPVLTVPAPAKFTSASAAGGGSMAAALQSAVPSKAIDCHVLGRYLDGETYWKKLVIDGANSVDDAGATEIARALRGNDVIEEIDVRNNRIGDAGAMALLSVVRDRGLVRVIEMENNPLGQQGWAELVRTMVFKDVHALSPIVDAALSNCPELCEQLVRAMYGGQRSLTLRPGAPGWTDEEAILVGGVLSTASLPTLQTFSLKPDLQLTFPAPGSEAMSIQVSQADLGPAGGIITAAFCGRKGTPVREVSIEGNDLGLEGVAAFGRMLAGQENASMAVLKMSNQKTPIPEKAVEALAEGVKGTKYLEALYYSGNGLQPTGCKLLGEALKMNRSIRTLALNDHGFGIKGAREFLRVLSSMPEGQIRDLRLAGNNLGRAGLDALESVLGQNRSLESLDIRNNGIAIKDIPILAKALKKSSTIMSINVAGCDLPVQDLIGVAGLPEVDLAEHDLTDLDAALMAMLAESHDPDKTLKILRLRDNKFGPVAGEAFAGMLKKNHCLEVLDLKNNKVEQQGAIALAGALRENRTLCSLNIQGNDLGADGGMAVVDVLRENEVVGVKVGGQWLGNAEHAWED